MRSTKRAIEISLMVALALAAPLPAAAAPAAPATVPAAAANPALLRLSVALPEKLDPGRLELRPYPSARETALYFLRGEETPPVRVVELDGKARQASLEASFGFWLLTYRDTRGPRLEAALVPLETSLDLGELNDSGGRWELRVVGPTGTPIAGARVGWRPKGSRRLWQPAMTRLETGADGRVLLPRPEVRGELWVLAPGHQPLAASYRREELPRRVRLVEGTGQVLRVVDRLRRPLAGALVSSAAGVPLGFTSPAGELEGPFADGDPLWIEDTAGHRWRERVIRQASRQLRVQVPRPVAFGGEVLDRRAGRRAIPGALVWIAGRPETWRRGDAKGRFELPDPLGEGEPALRIEAQAAGYSRASAAAAEDLTLTLDQANRVLLGRVSDTSGEPLAGAQVEVADQERRATWSTRTGEDGTYRLEGVPTGALWAEVSQPTYLAAKEPIHKTFAEVRLDVVLARGQKVGGQVISAAGQPLAAVAVLLAAPESAGEPARPQALTDRDGKFEIGPLAAGEHWLIFEARGQARRQVNLELAASEEEPIDLGVLELEDEQAWTGRVVDDDGEPLAEAEIFVWRGNEEDEMLLEQPTWLGPDATSGSDGKFALTGLKDGETISLEIRLPARPPFFANNLAIGPSGEGPDFVVPLGAALEVEVFDSLREPLPKAEVTLDRLGAGTFQSWQVADGDGKVFYSALKAGPFELRVKSKGYAVYQGTLELEKGDALTVQVVMGEEGAALDGRIWLPDGQPASGLQVFVDIGGKTVPPPIFARVDEAGFYHLEGLPNGNFILEVSGRNKYSPVYRQKVAIRLPQNQLDIELPASSIRELEVQVVGEDGQSLEGINVSIYYKKKGGGIVTLERRTDADGIALFSEVPQATYEIMAWAPDKSWKSGEARTKLDLPRKEIQLTLERNPNLPPLD